jgi:hypothetical protein
MLSSVIARGSGLGARDSGLGVRVGVRVLDVSDLESRTGRTLDTAFPYPM